MGSFPVLSRGTRQLLHSAPLPESSPTPRIATARAPGAESPVRVEGAELSSAWSSHTAAPRWDGSHVRTDATRCVPRNSLAVVAAGAPGAGAAAAHRAVPAPGWISPRMDDARWIRSEAPSRTG